jgi:hypothetical protein
MITHDFTSYIERHTEQGTEKIPVIINYAVEFNEKIKADVFSIFKITALKSVPFRKINSDEVERFFCEIFQHHDSLKKGMQIVLN